MSKTANVGRTVLVVHPVFHAGWPWAAQAFAEQLRSRGPLEVVEQEPGDTRAAHEVVPDPGTVRRLIVLAAAFPPESAGAFSGLCEAALIDGWREPPGAELLRAKGVTLYGHQTLGFWGQSVAEFGLALTLCALRRIPQTHHQMLSDPAAWDYSPAEPAPPPGGRGIQFGDDARFTSGTIAGKRVRIVGAGNIASRYAGFTAMLGGDVAAWDPYASEPCFHRSGARREHHLGQLVEDAEIFAPMLPLTDSTRGLVTAEHIDALPAGCLIVLVTRAQICDMTAVRRRVQADEVALAADVFDVEPLPSDDPLLGRHNVVHTPHNAGRTKDANEAYARAIVDQFRPYADDSSPSR